jgi:hypothetical protein
MDVHRYRHQVNSVRAEGAAAHQAGGRESEAAPEPVLGKRLNGVVGAAWVEATWGDAARGRPLIQRHQAHGSAPAPAQSAFGWTHARRPLDWPARSSACCTCSDSSPRSLRAAAGSTRRRYVPRGSVVATARADSRRRRRSVLRTTALPQCFPIAYPTWGYIPWVRGSAGTKVARTGPQLDRNRDR